MRTIFRKRQEYYANVREEAVKAEPVEAVKAEPVEEVTEPVEEVTEPVEKKTRKKKSE